MKWFPRYTWVVLGYNVLVILWGAYVRATGSGAGCGSHWPTCNGEIIPRSPQIETIIEFTHRLSSGLALVLLTGLWAWSVWRLEKGHPARTGAVFSMVFILTEALIGAALVLFQWVAGNTSVGRVIFSAVHLVNTFLLLAALTLTAWWASGGRKLTFQENRGVLWLFLSSFLGMLLIGSSGAITALGDTLFPVASLKEGFLQDISATAHFTIRLRIWHPVSAMVIGFLIFFLTLWQYNSCPEKFVRRFSVLLGTLFLVQLIVGLVNLLLLAPVAMQLIHLFVADLVWITLVLLFAASYREGERVMHKPE